MLPNGYETSVRESIPDLFLDLLASLELTAPGDPIHEDDVVRILESVMFGISGLSPEDKDRLRQAATRKAEQTTDPARRQFFTDAPRAFDF
jgi:hypothetical protein